MKSAHDKHDDTSILPDDYEVRGIFKTGYYEYDAHVIVTSLGNAQDLFDLGDSVHGLFVMVNDAYAAPAVKTELQKSLGQGFYASTWMEQNFTMLNALIVEKNVMFYIMFFIVLVAAFGITCTLITFVVLKTRDIGMLKALGASQRQIIWIFLSQSLVVSVLGVLTGTTLGCLGVAYRNEFLNLMNRLTGFELFPASIYGFSELPARVIPSDIAIICGGSLLICLLAALFPARHASKLNPVEALRNE